MLAGGCRRHGGGKKEGALGRGKTCIMSAATSPVLTPRPRSWKRVVLRWAIRLALCYLGVLLVLLALENWLLYPRTTAVQHWQPAPDARIRDVELQSADGTLIHAWWYPCDGADGAVLYCHGNAGNLSHRGVS